jgi:hypothetical protein
MESSNSGSQVNVKLLGLDSSASFFDPGMFRPNHSSDSDIAQCSALDVHVVSTLPEYVFQC